LYEEAIGRAEGRLSASGPLIVSTGQYTGRAPKDKYIVCDSLTKTSAWWGSVNTPMADEQFRALRARMMLHLETRDLFVQDCLAGADCAHQLPIRVITETAWHNLFARNLFIQPDPNTLPEHNPAFTVIHAPNFLANPAVDQTRSEVFVVINFSAGEVLIGGTHYAGEIKKAIFTVLNYLLPQAGVLSMHCSANRAIADPNNVALFFGLSGTGKTTLSTDPKRQLIGDDEHGWNDQGIFNLEGGCYAKVINLSPVDEPEIYAAASHFGTVLENVSFDGATGLINLHDGQRTENTRAAYPISYIRNAALDGRAGHPTNIVMLTADAFGVLPPVARLTPEQAVYHFLSGYTAKVAGTERGVTEPQATFSPCFGAPFMVLPPMVYAQLLRQKITQHKTKVWLVNTGWSGGPYGVGQRIKIRHTRALVNAILEGALDHVAYRRDPNFDLAVPTSCPNVPGEILDPRQTWADQAAYDQQAQRLVHMFDEHFHRVYPEVV
jgi:phosphoenolpyruvate carboxykinase (ATP)